MRRNLHPMIATGVFVTCLAVGGSIELADRAQTANEGIQGRYDHAASVVVNGAWVQEDDGHVTYWDHETQYVEDGPLSDLTPGDVRLDIWFGSDGKLADDIAADHAADVCADGPSSNPDLEQVRTEYLSLTMSGVDCGGVMLVPPATISAEG